MIEPCWAIQKPRGAPPMEYWSNSSLNMIPHPKDTENQTNKILKVIDKLAFQYGLVGAGDEEGFIIIW